MAFSYFERTKKGLFQPLEFKQQLLRCSLCIIRNNLLLLFWQLQYHVWKKR